ncbi:GTP-binding protein ERG [Cinnamomum micranthum f. kanehirae]|uniref:GTP-binding protein ERG n=1 Tax=Cinnamomum micranthum f. kanehirae TaxID=337451 RepID=A0A3S3QPV4_9MAGN|nr:GTP-binding protein ERG [Cinnamomum micranthum f. kanehirae]
MKAWKALRLLPSSSLLTQITQTTTTQKSHLLPTLSLLHFFSAQPQPHQDNFSNSTSPNEEGEDSDPTSIFDSSHFVLPTTPDSGSNPRPEPTWNEAYRAKVDRTLFGVDPQKQQQQQQKELKPKKKKKGKSLQTLEEDDEDKVKAARLAKALLQAALEKPDDFEEGEEGTMSVKEEDQRSLSVGIVGAPNAGKSSLTNYMKIDGESFLLCH